MGRVQIQVGRTTYGSKAVFDGEVVPDGATGYRFWGTLKASMGLHRSGAGFSNTVALGSGGTSDVFHYLEYALPDDGVEASFPVSGSGTRLANETVDFRIGFNEGTSAGVNTYAPKVTVYPGGPWQTVAAEYQSADSNGTVMYDVRFNGKVRSDGPTGYVVTGELDAMEGPGAMTTQYATVGFKFGNDGWQYETYACKDTPQTFTFTGERGAGDGVKVVVGATAQVFNLYGYGKEVGTALPEKF
ncbi:hypothetical protein [Streptomyces sp. NPDC058157]|uniref:hypothetical protein n=1 Tax=Streptomyces sp. NPDC058157 TaxID=3346360 RepID=UPI0036EDBD00